MQLVWTTGHLTISSINPEESMYRAWNCSVCICFRAFDKDSFQMPVTDSQSWTASWLYEISLSLKFCLPKLHHDMIPVTLHLFNFKLAVQIIKYISELVLTANICTHVSPGYLIT